MYQEEEWEERWEIEACKGVSPLSSAGTKPLQGFTMGTDVIQLVF